MAEVETSENSARVGTDLVIVTEEALVIHAHREMPDWTLREFCVVPIYFRGHKFYLKKKSPGQAPYAMKYELGTWHDALGGESTLSINYDEDYVEERDRKGSMARGMEHLHSILTPLYPLLGFTWTGFKERVLSPIGFDARSITEASMLLAFSYWMLEGVFAFYFRGGFLAFVCSSAPLLWLDWALVVVLPLDCAIRFGRLIRGDSIPCGFLEWLFRRKPGDWAGFN